MRPQAPSCVRQRNLLNSEGVSKWSLRASFSPEPLPCLDLGKTGRMEVKKPHDCPHIPPEVPLAPPVPTLSFVQGSRRNHERSRSTLRRHAKDGRLHTVQLGRRRVIPFEALREMFKDSGKSA